MSKRVRIDIQCPQCGKQYSDDFYRTIWGEHEENRSMVMEDRINITRCPFCNHTFHLPLAMMYVDVKKGFAVWWEPNHDEGVDSDSAEYSKMFGSNSYYAKAPRIADWTEFKRTVNKYYSGELVGGKVKKMDMSALRSNKSKKGGCLNILVVVAILLIFIALC